MTINSGAILNAVASHAAASGHFDHVTRHEPKNAPGNGLHAAIWVQHLGPVPANSSLKATSAVLVANVRIGTNMLQEPQDDIDPLVLDATDYLMTAYSANFTLGGLIQAVDLLGRTGRRLQADAGYLTIGGRGEGSMYRVMVLQVPMIVNDAWEQVA